METMKRKGKGLGDPSARIFLIPYGLNLRFFGRDDELRILKEAIEPSCTRLRAIGIHGAGGVGKTQLALQYANTSLDMYQVIVWIPADTQTNIVHALSNLAKKLGLVDGASGEDDCGNVDKVRDWLNTASKPFLLVFDDVDNIELLDPIWPANKRGSIIITSRSPLVATGRTTITLALKSFSADTTSQVLRTLSQLDFADDKEEAAAHKRLSGWTNGFPLAVMQISNFIRNRGTSYVETRKMMRECSRTVYSTVTPEYGHTVLTVWDTSLRRLSPGAMALLKLLAFFDPDEVPERFITNMKAIVHDGPLGFVVDKSA
jgi:hypothetical protein